MLEETNDIKQLFINLFIKTELTLFDVYHHQVIHDTYEIKFEVNLDFVLFIVEAVTSKYITTYCPSYWDGELQTAMQCACSFNHAHTDHWNWYNVCALTI